MLNTLQRVTVHPKGQSSKIKGALRVGIRSPRAIFFIPYFGYVLTNRLALKAIKSKVWITDDSTLGFIVDAEASFGVE